MTAKLVALERTDNFVGRTTNWLYDHLRLVPRYRCAVLCEELQNRDEFPELMARSLESNRLSRRIWHRIVRRPAYPTDWLWLKRLGPKLLHSHFGYVAARDLKLAQSLGVPWFVSFYGADVYQLSYQPDWQQSYPEIFKHATQVLALGPVMAAKLRELGCPPSKIRVHPLGVDVNALPVKPRVLKRNEPLRLVFAGTFREKKGVQYLIEAAAIATKRGVPLELHVIGEASSKPGDRETKEAALQLIRDFDLAKIVVLHPFLRFRELLELALESHVFLAPSVTSSDGDAEGTPFVLQQMMATSMPCIATLHSDIPFLFGRHRHLLVPERDSRSIADRLISYAENPHRLLEDGQLLSNQIRTFFDARIRAGQLCTLYDGGRDDKFKEVAAFSVGTSGD